MSEFPAKARAVVIGCGIVGNSLSYHLTRLGWTDVVQIDKGPLPNPGGSTGHASNFIFPVDHSKEMTQLTLESFAARLAAERANDDDREVARALLAELPGLAGTRDERALIELDQRIHRHVYRCAHNPFVESTLNEYYTLTLRIWFLALDRVARLDDAVAEHGELLQAILDRDAARAEAVMRRHIEAFERAIRAVL